MDEGTIVHVDYELYNGEDGDLIETTREDVAKEHDIHQDGRTYTPMVCVVGSGQLIPGFDTALMDAKPDKEIEVVIAPTEGYGEKDPELMETISFQKLASSVQDPRSLYIGAPVTINGRQGIVTYVAAGRARIDYNHPMAGKTLKYSFKIVEVVDGDEAKVMALLESTTGHTGFEVEMKGKDVTITLPQTMLFDTNASLTKFRVVTTLRESMECGTVRFVEVHEDRAFSSDDHDHDHNHDHDHDHDHEHVEDLTKLTVSELKERCKARGLPVGGKKSDLIERLSDEEE